MPARSHQRNVRRRQRGVTLAEITAVTLVLAIAASAAVMNGASVDEARAQAAAAGVAQALRFARDESLRTGIAHGVELDGATRRVRVFRVDASTLPHAAVFDVRDPLSKKLYVMDLAVDPDAAGVSLTHAPVWRGACTAVNRVVFRHAATVTLARGAAQRTVRLEGFVARVWLP